jgi:hypothetical protein
VEGATSLIRVVEGFALMVDHKYRKFQRICYLGGKSLSKSYINRSFSEIKNF